MIKSKDISFVVQGPLNPDWTRRCLMSIREHFPKSEVILCSTQSDNMEMFDTFYDHFLRIPDPGANTQQSNGLRNINRQIATTLSGLLIANRPYVIKIRTDTIILHNNIRHYIDLYDKPTDGFFDKRIVATNLYTLRPTDQPMYISDFVYAGTRGDLIKLFTIPLLYDEPGCGPEQYISSKYIMNKLGMKHFSEISVDLATKILANEFIILDGQRQFGILNLKYPHYKDNWCDVMLRYNEWVQMYYDHLRSKY